MYSRTKSAGKSFNANKANDELYDRAWNKYRQRFLAINPKCYACGNKATVVDHVVAHKGNVSLFKKLDNHIPLCAICHNTITAHFDRGLVTQKSIMGKLNWLSTRRLHADLLHLRVKVLSYYSDK